MTATHELRALVRALEADFLKDAAPDKRYSAALIRRALQILEREQTAPRPPDAELLAAMGETDRADVAQRIRARGQLPDDLHDLLRGHVRSKLAVTNPEYLER